MIPSLQDLESTIREEIAGAPGETVNVARQAAFLALLLHANQHMNLVSHKSAEPRNLIGGHLLDSLFGLSFLPKIRETPPLRLLDIGSGGGFPAIPLLIERPDFTGVLIESTQKKARFLENVIRELNLGAEVRAVRFPEGFSSWKERFEVVTTRAVASAGHIIRQARPGLVPQARALLWTTAPLFAAALEESGARQGRFHERPESQQQGIGVFEGLRG